MDQEVKKESQQMECTLSLLKPDVTKRNLTGRVNSRIEEAHFEIIAQKRLHLTLDQAARFYDVHKDRNFFEDLCRSMCCGPIVAQVLRKENAITDYRSLMGATNPSAAQDNTLRKEFGVSIEENSVHGSDSFDTACKEIPFFFSQIELLPWVK